MKRDAFQYSKFLSPDLGTKLVIPHTIVSTQDPNQPQHSIISSNGSSPRWDWFGSGTETKPTKGLYTSICSSVDSRQTADVYSAVLSISHLESPTRCTTNVVRHVPTNCQPLPMSHLH